MAKHLTSFPPLMVNMIRAGEIGGFLDAVLLQLAENYEAEVKLRGKVKSAMTSPRCGTRWRTSAAIGAGQPARAGRPRDRPLRPDRHVGGVRARSR